MPWPSGRDYAERHNKKLSGHAATVAAKTATALVAKGIDEGRAIRIANAQGDRVKAKADRRYRNRE